MRTRDSWLSWFLRGILIFGFLIIIARLIEIQVIKGDYFRGLAEENRIRRISITAPRGTIFARGGETLVGNKPIKKRIIFTPEAGYQISDDLSGAREDEIVNGWKREYKLGPAFAHVSGYLGEVMGDEAGKIDPSCPEKGARKAGDLVGRSGLEEEYNCILRGIDGEELIEVDTSGKKIRTLGKREPIPGSNLKTTIDFNLQKKVAEALGDKKGAVLAIDPMGEVLALYSSPSFDPEKVAPALNDKDLPLFNRAIGGVFHPGSIFKPIVAASALVTGAIDANFLFNDPGVITVNKFSYTNWYFSQYGKTEGTINLVRAITRSTDTFFYKVGEMTGPEAIADWAHKFGLGEATGIDIPGEVSGLVPTPEWKRRVKGESWFLGNTYHFSIGQGDIAVSPIQITSGISAIASGGELCRPHLIIGDSQCKKIDIKKEDLELIKRGMIGACAPGGTGFTFFDFKPQVACKTGTAETSLEGFPHAWFVVFAPADLPEIVATVLVEKGGEGSKVAGPIAREILDYWETERP